MRVVVASLDALGLPGIDGVLRYGAALGLHLREEYLGGAEDLLVFIGSRRDQMLTELRLPNVGLDLLSVQYLNRRVTADFQSAPDQLT
ncbi:hypothetical protein ACFY3J_17570 [Streptomyces sp. NPDC001231]|uniref:hypothetical protein n=1 Tax=Streptomyces sp. NPDC001231 TaxID=3364549 RepID=UPI003698CDAC